MNPEINRSFRKEELFQKSPFLRSLLSPERALQTSMEDFLDADLRITTSIARSYSQNWITTLGEPLFGQAIIHKIFIPDTTLEQGVKPIIGMIKIGYELDSYKDIYVLYPDIAAFAKQNRMFNKEQLKRDSNYTVVFANQIISIVNFGLTLKLQGIEAGTIIKDEESSFSTSSFTDFVNTLNMDNL